MTAPNTQDRADLDAPENVDALVQPFSEIGLTGLKRSGGTIQEELLPQLSGDRAVKVYKEMADNDAIVGAMLFAIDKIVRRVHWTVLAGGDTPQDDEATDFIDSCKDDMSITWSDFISEVMSMLVYGWSLFEIVYKKRNGPLNSDPTQRSRYTDGKIGLRKLAIRAQDTLDRWVFDDEGGVQAMVQRPPPDYDPRIIPIEKSLLFRTTAHKGNPEGRSVLRNAYRQWFFKRRFEEIEAIGISRDLAGLPIAYVPPQLLADDASAEDAAALEALKKLVRNVRRDDQEGIVFPLAYDEDGRKLYEFGLLSSGGRRQFDTTRIIERSDQRIAMVTLSDVILIGHEAVGSFALANSKTNLFGTAIGTYLDHIEGVLNRHLVPRLLTLNNMATENPPRFTHGDIGTRDLAELGEFVNKLGGSGMSLFPSHDGELERALLEHAGLPAPTPEVFEAEKEAQLEREAAEKEERAAMLQNLQSGNQPPQQQRMPGDGDGDGEFDE